MELKCGGDPDPEEPVIRRRPISGLHVHVGKDPTDFSATLDGEDITERLRVRSLAFRLDARSQVPTVLHLECYGSIDIEPDDIEILAVPEPGHVPGLLS